MADDDDTSAPYQPPPSLWQLIESFTSSHQLPDVKCLLGESLVEQSVELHREVSSYHCDEWCCLWPYSICRIRVWIRVGFSENVHSVRKSKYTDSLAKPEILSSRMTSHQHHQHKQTTIAWHSTTFTHPYRSICQWIQIRIHCESESRFDQIDYGRSQAC